MRYIALRSGAVAGEKEIPKDDDLVISLKSLEKGTAS